MSGSDVGTGCPSRNCTVPEITICRSRTQAFKTGSAVLRRPGARRWSNCAPSLRSTLGYWPSGRPLTPNARRRPLRSRPARRRLSRRRRTPGSRRLRPRRRSPRLLRTLSARPLAMRATLPGRRASKGPLQSRALNGLRRGWSRPGRQKALSYSPSFCLICWRLFVPVGFSSYRSVCRQPWLDAPEQWRAVEPHYGTHWDLRQGDKGHTSPGLLSQERPVFCRWRHPRKRRLCVKSVNFARLGCPLPSPPLSAGKCPRLP